MKRNRSMMRLRLGVSKYGLASAVAAIFLSSLVLAVPSAAATTNVTLNSAECATLGGTWNISTSTCVFALGVNPVIPSGTILTVPAGLAVVLGSIFTNNGGIINDGVITLAALGTMTNNGNMANLGVIKVLTGGVLNNPGNIVNFCGGSVVVNGGRITGNNILTDGCPPGVPQLPSGAGFVLVIAGMLPVILLLRKRNLIPS